MAKLLVQIGALFAVVGTLLILWSWFGGQITVNPHAVIWPGITLALIGYALGGHKNA